MTVGASEQPVYLVLEEWEFKGEMTIDMAQVINENIDQLMEKELEQIIKLIEVDKPDSAFVAMLRLTSFLNAGAAKLPSIISRLEKWINKIKIVLNSLAKKIGANGYSISAGIPIGVSVGLSFPIFYSEKIVVLQLTACLRRFAKLPKGNFENTRNVSRNGASNDRQGGTS